MHLRLALLLPLLVPLLVACRPPPSTFTVDETATDEGVLLAPGLRIAPAQLVPGRTATITYGAPARLASASHLILRFGFNYAPDEAACELPMKRLGPAVFQATVALPETARLLDLAFRDEDAPARDDLDGAGYHRSVDGPLLGPYLTLRDNLAGQPDRDPARSILVSFRTDHRCLGRVRHGPSGGPLSPGAADETPVELHHLALTGLAPDTAYDYVAECSTAPGAPVESSPRYSFRTAAPGASSFSFLLLSDAQVPERWRAAAAALQAPPFDQARFLVLAGDLTGADDPASWWGFFDAGRQLFASRPLVPAMGNHDILGGAAAHYLELFPSGSSSGNDACYGLRYGSAAFLLLDSVSASLPADWLAGGAQRDWVERVLPELGGLWRFAVWHVPPYNAGARHHDEELAVRPMTALFNDRVDWVLSGHEHLYQRLRPLRYTGQDEKGTVTSAPASSYGPGSGVGYLVTPAFGQLPASALVPAATSERALLVRPGADEVSSDAIQGWNGFVRITLDGRTLQLEAFEHGRATPRDRISYSKPGPR